MSNSWNSGLPFLQGNEQDFPLGAKATAYLLPANFDAPESRHDAFEFPEVDPFEELQFRSSEDVTNETTDDDLSHEIINGSSPFEHKEEDYENTIKPEDMLVPLSELQPEKYAATPQGIGANTLLAAAVPSSSTPIPKVAIRVNRIQIPVQKLENNNLGGMSSYITSSSAAVFLQNAGNHLMQPQNFVSNQYDSGEEFTNQLAIVANTEPNELAHLISSFYASVLQADTDDFLSQLESHNTNDTVPDVPKWTSEPASPVPSVGSLPPHTDIDQSFHHSPSTCTIDDDALQPKGNNTLLCSALSPLSEDIITASSPAPFDDDCDMEYIEPELHCDMEYIKPELHSYSRSPSRRKNTRKSRCGTSFPEGRKERKKEQNKQAAFRYRQKKKQEDDELMTTLKAETERQKKLKAQYSDLKQERSYCKKLLREIFIAKGILSPKSFEKKFD